MARRNPQAWLMTDERMGDALWTALRRLPPGSGVVLRHHATPPAERTRLIRQVRAIAHARRLVLIVQGSRQNPVRIAPAHNRAEALAGVRAGTNVLFVSPVHATRSHPGQPALGLPAAIRVARGLSPSIIALGGMDARRWRRIRRFGFDGWAAIDAWMR